MANRATLLFAYGNVNDLILAADGRSTLANGAVGSYNARKLALCGTRGACAVGGFCEGIVKEGPRAGWHWRLLDAVAALTKLPTRSASDRAEFVFESAYSSAAEYMPHDSDPATPGRNDLGITILYGEVSRMADVYLYRADMPVTVLEDSDSKWKWSVDHPVPRAIFPGSDRVGLPFLYLHQPEVHESTNLVAPKDDKVLAGSLEQMFQLFAQQHAPETVGGRIAAIRIGNDRARWVNA